jgi:hypothetical protein
MPAARPPEAWPAHHGTGKGALVLQSSLPPVAPEANSNGPSAGPNRPTTATAAVPIASTASASGDPRGQIGPAWGPATPQGG